MRVRHVVRRQKRLNDKRAVKRVFVVGDWTCKLDSPWMGPYLVVSLAGWAMGVQLQTDSPILMIHCQDLKTRGVWCRGLVWTVRLHRLCTRSWALYGVSLYVGVRLAHSIRCPVAAVWSPDRDLYTTSSRVTAGWPGSFRAIPNILNPKPGYSTRWDTLMTIMSCIHAFNYQDCSVATHGVKPAAYASAVPILDQCWGLPWSHQVAVMPAARVCRCWSFWRYLRWLRGTRTTKRWFRQMFKLCL